MVEKKVIIAVVVFLVTGTATTLLTKLSNQQESVGISKESHPFQHPFLQCWGLSVGEASCFILFLVSNAFKKRKETPEDRKKDDCSSFSPFLFIPAAILHLTSRILIFIGLLLTSASSFQMLSGCNLIFTCIFSRIFLKKSLPWYKWFAIFVITAGVIIVGVADLLLEKGNDSSCVSEDKDPVLGDAFVVMGMLFWAGQMTYEEKFVKKFNIKPLNAVGLEGSFALSILTALLVIFYFIPPYFNILDGDRMEDALDGFVQLGNNPILLVSFIGTTFALCCSLIAGVSITRNLSAIHRIIIDSGRSIAVWAASLALGWQCFMWLQILGFLVMSVGVLIFNNILIIGPGNPVLLQKCGYSGFLNTEASSSSQPVITNIKGKENSAFVDLEEEQL